MNITHYAKTFGPLLVAVIVSVLSFLRDNPIGGVAGVVIPALSIAIAILNVFITYRVPNDPDAGVIMRNLKAWANVVHAGVQALLVILVGGLELAELTIQDWSVVGLALIGAGSVWLYPNEPEVLGINSRGQKVLSLEGSPVAARHGDYPTT